MWTTDLAHVKKNEFEVENCKFRKTHAKCTSPLWIISIANVIAYTIFGFKTKKKFDRRQALNIIFSSHPQNSIIHTSTFVWMFLI